MHYPKSIPVHIIYSSMYITFMIFFISTSHPQYGYFLPFPHTISHAPHSSRSPLLATQLIRRGVICMPRMGVVVIRYSVRRVESRVVTVLAASAQAGGA